MQKELVAASVAVNSSKMDVTWSDLDEIGVFLSVAMYRVCVDPCNVYIAVFVVTIIVIVVSVWSFDGRNGVSRNSSALEVEAGHHTASDGSSGLILPAFPQRRESFLYRPSLDSDLEMVPKSLSRNLCVSTDQSWVAKHLICIYVRFARPPCVSSSTRIHWKHRMVHRNRIVWRRLLHQRSDYSNVVTWRIFNDQHSKNAVVR